MPQQGPLYWLDGEGWLVLLGGGDWRRGETDQVDARLLSLANLDRPMVVLLSEGSRREAEEVLEHYTLLGGPGGEAFSLAAMTRDQLHTPDFLSLLQEAGILYLGGDNPIPLVRNLYNTPALQRIVEGYTTLQALTIIGAGGGAVALGRVAVGPPPDYLQAMGLGLVATATVVPHFTRTEDSVVMQNLHQLENVLLGLGIPDGTALALGPAAQVETWGGGMGGATVTAVVKAAEES